MILRGLDTLISCNKSKKFKKLRLCFQFMNIWQVRLTLKKTTKLKRVFFYGVELMLKYVTSICYRKILNLQECLFTMFSKFVPPAMPTPPSRTFKLWSRNPQDRTHHPRSLLRTQALRTVPKVDATPETACSVRTNSTMVRRGDLPCLRDSDDLRSTSRRSTWWSSCSATAVSCP